MGIQVQLHSIAVGIKSDHVFNVPNNGKFY